MAEKSKTTGPHERTPVLRECRNLKMAASAHAYVRGNTLKFYEWLAAADKSKIPRIEDTAPTIPLGKHFWPLNSNERAEVERFFATEEVRRLVTSLRCRKDGARVKVLDAAYWVKGCSSLGRLRLAVLVGVGRHSRENGGLCLIDIKEAVKAAAPRHADAAMPRDNAVRVTQGARHISPALGERMLAARFLDRSVFLRELLPQDLKVEIEEIGQKEAVKAARYLASVVGKAHARQIDAETRARWSEELQRSRTANLGDYPGLDRLSEAC
jgi:uncharacterized protein (DUF2252 family)